MQSLNRKVNIVYRVPEFLYSRMIWVPSPASECGSLLGGATLAAGGGSGGAESYDCTETLVLCILLSLYGLNTE
jgi:hypothetical protein